MAAGDPIVAVGTAKTLEASGASISVDATVQADDATYVLSTDAAGWPDAEFSLTCAFGTAPTAGRVLLLLARALDVAGANDAPVPSSTHAAHYVGAFSVSATTATQYLPLSGLVAYDLPRAAEYYVCNSTNQTVSSGWQLTVTPRAIVPTP